MAPPSYGPPGYSIPQRYMNREPPPEGADTNTRPYLIFFSYMLTCASVSVFIISRIFKKYAVLKKSTTAAPPPSKHVWLFGALAAGSLLTTWTYMVKYFNVSYQTWLMWRSYWALDPAHRHWGLWLKETGLFREAWETVVVGNARYWWSHQIFFFALGLGLYLEQKGMAFRVHCSNLADPFRCKERHQAHLGLHASGTNCGNQLCYEPVSPYVDSKPAGAGASIDVRSSTPQMAGSMATQSGSSLRDRHPSIPARR